MRSESINNKGREFRVGLLLNYFATAVGLISSLVFNPIIIRALGQSEYGLYETMGSFVNNLAILDLGFGSVIVRYTAKYEKEGLLQRRDEFLYTARRIYQYLGLAILIGGAFLYSLLGTVFGNSFSSEELRKAHTLFLFVLGTTVLSVYGQVYSGALTGVEKFIIPRVIRIIKLVFGKIVCILVLFLGADSVGYTAVLFVIEILALVINRLYASYYVQFKKSKIKIKEIKELLVFTSYILLQAIASQLYWQIDKLVLGAMIGTAVVAVYSVSINLQNIVQNISVSIKDVLLPKATHIAVEGNNPDRIHSFMVQSSRLVLVVYGIAQFGLIILGKEFITLWIGSEYIEAYRILIILSFASLIPSILASGEIISKAYNKHQFLSFVTVFAAVVNLLLTILFVRRWGMIGAAVATMIGLVFGNTLIPLLYYKKHFSLNIKSYFIDVFSGILPALLMATLIGFGINLIFTGYNWFILFLKMIVICTSYVFALRKFGFTLFENTMFNNMILKFLTFIRRSK